MINPIELLNQGGPLATIALVIGFLGVGIAGIAPLIIGLMKWRLPASVAWLALTLTVVLAALGAFVGRGQVDSAIAFASLEMVQSMVAAGIVIVVFTAISAYGTVALGFLLTSIATALPAPIRPGPSREPTSDRCSAPLAEVLWGGCLWRSF